MQSIVESVLAKMSSISKPQKKFIIHLLLVLSAFQGRANFRNLSRYSEMSEKRFSRQYAKSFDFTQFNDQLLRSYLNHNDECIAAIDASFIPKSGQTTQGLGKFYNPTISKSERGLEASLVCIINLRHNTGYTLNVEQTMVSEEENKTQFYANQVVKLASEFQHHRVRYIACDAYYTKKVFVDTVQGPDLDIVGKLRIDADLQWLYEGKQKKRGRPKQYDGKVDYDKDLERFDYIGYLESGENIYSKIVYSKNLKRNIRVVMLTFDRGGKEGRCLLYSTDTQLDTEDIIRYYKARFQIEFVFRDAKQHIGFAHCQSRKKERINFHLQASLTCLNILKIEDLKQQDQSDSKIISIATWKRRKFNQLFANRIFVKLGVNISPFKVKKSSILTG